MPSTEQAFRAACESWPTQAVAAGHVKQLCEGLLERLLDSSQPSEVEGALRELERLFELPPAPHAAEALEVVMAALLPALSPASEASPNAAAAFRRLASKMAGTCSPRDTTLLLLGQLSTVRPLSPAEQALAPALAAVLGRLTRRRNATLGEVLATLMQRQSAGYLTLLTGSGDSDARAPSALEFCEGLEVVYTALAASLAAWPAEEARAGRASAAASLLGFVEGCKLALAPLPGVPPGLPAAAAAHFQQQPQGMWAGDGLLLALSAVRAVRRLLPALGVGSLQALMEVQWDASEEQVGEDCLQEARGVLLFSALCDPGRGPPLEPCPPQLQLAAASRYMPALGKAAFEMRNVAAMQKAFSLAVAACQSASAEAPLAWGPQPQGLLNAAAQAMASNPVQTVRNCASHTFHAILASFKAEALAPAAAYVREAHSPGVSAHLLQSLTQRATADWPAAGEAAGKDWAALAPQLLPAALEWLQGGSAPRDVPSLLAASEALCAALNLLRFLLLRERGAGSDHTGAAQAERLAAVRAQALLPLRGLCEAGLRAAADAQERLAVERVCEVLGRVLELAERGA